jgi:hypothetical protein
MDLIQRAHEKREQLRAELSRIEAFLATAHDLQQEFSRPGTRDTRSDAAKADAPAAAGRKRGGVGAETLDAAVAIIRERGEPMSTRELLPLILAKGVPVGGNDPIATLSARISNKGVLHLTRGKWWPTVDDFENLDAQASGKEEATDLPTKDQSAASLFTNQGGTDAAALVN